MQPATVPSALCPHDTLAKKLLAVDTALRSTRRSTRVRLALAAVALCTVLWVLETDLVWRFAGSAQTRWAAVSDSATSIRLRSEMRYARQRNDSNSDACVKLTENHMEREYYNPQACFTRAEVQHMLLQLVWSLAAVLERNNIPYWLDSGTLLGAYRSQTVIPYDVDADIGITHASYKELRDRQLVGIPDAYELQVYKGKFHRQGTRDAAIPSRFIHRATGFYVDIFVFLQSKTRETHFGPLPSLCFAGCFRCSVFGPGRTAFKIPKSWVFPLQSCAYGGRNVSCPAQPAPYLDYLYGPEFMTPRQY